MLNSFVRTQKARLSILVTSVSERIPPSVKDFWAAVWRGMVRLSDSSPLASMLLFALLIGTFGAVVSQVVFPNHTPVTSSYDVMRKFFAHREDFDFSRQEKLVELEGSALDPESHQINRALSNDTQSLLRVQITYPNSEAGPDHPLSLKLVSSSNRDQAAEVFSASLIPGPSPTDLRFIADTPNLQVQLTRAESLVGSDWPEVTIAVGELFDE